MSDEIYLNPKPAPFIVLMAKQEVEALLRRKNYLLETLKAEEKKVEEEVDEIDRKLGLDKIRWVDHVQGTNCAEWECTSCGERFVCSTKALCPNCRPLKEE